MRVWPHRPIKHGPGCIHMGHVTCPSLHATLYGGRSAASTQSHMQRGPMQWAGSTALVKGSLKPVEGKSWMGTHSIANVPGRWLAQVARPCTQSSPTTSSGWAI